MSPFASVARDFSELVLILEPTRTDWEQLRRQVHQRAQDLRRRLDELKQQASEPSLKTVIEASSRDLVELSESLTAAPALNTRQRLYARLAQSYERLVHAF